MLIDGASAGALASHTFTDVQTAHTIAASFAIDTRTLTYRAGAGGTISAPASKRSTTDRTVPP